MAVVHGNDTTSLQLNVRRQGPRVVKYTPAKLQSARNAQHNVVACHCQRKL